MSLVMFRTQWKSNRERFQFDNVTSLKVGYILSYALLMKGADELGEVSAFHKLVN